jgi:hypothetical protein
VILSPQEVLSIDWLSCGEYPELGRWASNQTVSLLETALFQTGRFASEFTQIVDLCPPHSASGHHFDFVYNGRMQRKYAFHPHTI